MFLNVLFEDIQSNLNHCYFSLSLSDWGYPDILGCRDKSGVVKKMDNNSSCGSQYSYLQSEYDVTWTWFKCKQTGKCIHNTTRCDLHPHPDCIYENEKKEMVAEDEEGCLEEYKRKGLLPRSANFKCQSPHHNSNSSAVFATWYNNTSYVPNALILDEGIMVQILATRCNGQAECWNAIDEDRCGFNISITASIGK